MEGNRKVCFLPSPAGNAAVTSPPTARKTPFVLLSQDIVILFSMINLLPKLLLPFSTNKPSDELYLSGQNIFYLSLLALVTVLECILIVILLPALPIFPGIATFAFVGLGYGIIYGLCAPTRGPLVIESSSDILPPEEAERWTDEKWIFINGTFVTSHGFKENCDRIARTFGRPITGLYNPTLALIGDIVECIIQRSFSYNTYCTRYAYDYLKARLEDPKIRKVVLISHSQGGIIASMALDLLFEDMPVENIAKIEVYTFGCAASHFNNPLRAIDSSSHTARARVIPYMEHYANSDDPVTRWGVLYNVCIAPDNTFMGKVFVRRHASGHLLNQHYLSNIFPLPGEEADLGNGSSFLDEIVDVHEQLTRRRECSARRNLSSFYRSTSSYGSFPEVENPELMDDVTITQLDKKAGLDALHFVVVGNKVSGGREADKDPGAKNVSRKTAGRTVRELSRLWRYMGGMDPDRQELSSVEDGKHEGKNLRK